MITKDQVGDRARTRQHKEGVKELRSSTRSRVSNPSYTALLDIGRMTSQEYDFHVLGIGKDPKVKQCAQVGRKEKKEGEASKFNTHLKLGEKALETRSINFESDFSEAVDSPPKAMQENGHRDVVKKNLFSTSTATSLDVDEGNNQQQEESPAIPLDENTTKTTNVEALEVQQQPNNKSVQTDSFPCQSCAGMLGDLKSLMEKYSCKEACVTASTLQIPANSGVSKKDISVSSIISISDGMEELVPLVKGSKIKVPLIKKSNLKLHVTTGDPQDMVNHMLEWFYTPLEMANMTADGKTGGEKLNSDIADAIMTFVHSKYDSGRFNFDAHLFKTFVNAKCYNERKKLWHTNPQMPGLRPRKERKRKAEGEEHVNKGSKAASDKRPAKRTKSKIKSPHRRPTTGGKQPKLNWASSASEFLRVCSAEREDKLKKTRLSHGASPHTSTSKGHKGVVTSTPLCKSKKHPNFTSQASFLSSSPSVPTRKRKHSNSPAPKKSKTHIKNKKSRRSPVFLEESEEEVLSDADSTRAVTVSEYESTD